LPSAFFDLSINEFHQSDRHIRISMMSRGDVLSPSLGLPCPRLYAGRSLFRGVESTSTEEYSEPRVGKADGKVAKKIKKITIERQA